MLNLITISLDVDEFLNRTQKTLINVNVEYRWIVVLPASFRIKKHEIEGATILFQDGKGIPNAYNVALHYIDEIGGPNDKIIFINSGDEILSIKKDEVNFEEDFVSYSILASTERFRLKRIAKALSYSDLKKNMWKFLTGNPIPHQGTIYKVDCFSQIKYNEMARTASDTELNLSLILAGKTYVNRSKVIAKFYLGGVSSFKMYVLYRYIKGIFKSKGIGISLIENIKIHLTLARRFLLAPIKKYL